MTAPRCLTTVGLASVGLSEASHGNQLPALREEGKAASLRCFSIGIGREGDGQVVDRRVRGVVGALVRSAAVADDHHLGGDSVAAIGPGKRVVVDRDVGGEGVE